MPWTNHIPHSHPHPPDPEKSWNKMVDYMRAFLQNLLFPKYNFPLDKILSGINKASHYELYLDVRDNDILEWVLERLEAYTWKNIEFKIHLRDWIEKEKRWKIEEMSRKGFPIGFVWGIKKESEFWYTTLEEWIDNIPFIKGKIIDAETGEEIFFQEVQIRGERVFRIGK